MPWLIEARYDKLLIDGDVRVNTELDSLGAQYKGNPSALRLCIIHVYEDYFPGVKSGVRVIA